MALNNMGLGFVITAENQSKAAFKEVQGDLNATKESSEKGSLSADKLSDGFKSAGEKMAIVGAGIAAVLAVAAFKANELDDAMNLVSTRADEAVTPIENLKASVVALSNQYGIGAVDEAHALYDAIAKGAKDAASQQSVLTAANQLAVGTHTDLQTAMGTTTQVLRAFNLDFSHSGEVADQLFIATKNGAGSLSELSAELEHLAPTAARAGLGAKDLLGTLTGMSAAGLQGRAALGGMKGILDTLAAPSADAKAAAAALGVTLDKAAIQSQGFGNWLLHVVQSGKATDAQLQKLFGNTESVTAALAIAKNGGKDFAGVLAQMGGSAGAAGTAATKMIDQWDRFGTLKDNVLAKLGAGLQPFIDKVLIVLNAFMDWFTSLPEGVSSAISVTLAFTAGTLLLAGAVAGLVAAFLAMDTALLPVLIAFAAVIQIMALLAAAMVPVAIAIYGLKLAWDQNLGGIQTTITEFYDKVKLVWDGLVQLFTDGGFSGAVMTELNKAGNSGLKNFVITLFLWGSRIGAFFSNLKQGFQEAIAASAPVFARLSAAFSALGAAWTRLFGGANDPQKSAASYNAFASAGKAVGAALERIVNIVVTGITAATNFVGAFIDGLARFRPTFDAIGDAFSTIFGELGQLVDAFSGATEGVGETGSSLQGFGTVLANVVGVLAQGLAMSLRFVAAGIRPMISAIRGIGEAWQAMKQWATDAFNAVVSGALALAAKVAAVADKIASAFGKNLGASNAIAELQKQFAAPSGSPGVAGAGGPTPIAASTPALTTVSASSPGVVAAQAAAARLQGGETGERAATDRALVEGMAQLVQAIKSNNGQPIQVHLDGEKIAEVVGNQNAKAGARAFAPAPAPGG